MASSVFISRIHMKDLVLLCSAPGRGTGTALFHSVPAFDDVAEIPVDCPNCKRKLPDEADSHRAPGVVSWQPCQCVVCLPCAWKELVRIKGTGSRPSCPNCWRLGLSLFFSAESISTWLSDYPRVMCDADELITAFSKLPREVLSEDL